MHTLIENTHPQWQPILHHALQAMKPDYLQSLAQSNDWLPGISALLAAFSRPLSDTNYILFGESPYPRPQSANGYAFWDQAVHNLWSNTGLSKEVNRATSLRNLLKMLLVARGDLQQDCSQQAIAHLDKSAYWQTAGQLFNAMLKKGFLLLNASLVYRENEVRWHAKHWYPFMHRLLLQLAELKPSLKLLLFGRIAEEIPDINFFSCLIAEHPYNLSFITNQNVLNFFKPLDLLSC